MGLVRRCAEYEPLFHRGFLLNVDRAISKRLLDGVQPARRGAQEVKRPSVFVHNGDSQTLAWVVSHAVGVVRRGFVHTTRHTLPLALSTIGGHGRLFIASNICVRRQFRLQGAVARA